MPNTYERDVELIKKIKEGTTYEKLAKEYNISISSIRHIVEKHEMLKAYCDEMKSLIGKNEINQETKLYELSKLLKFDTRSINALIAKNIRSIDELLSLTEEDIYKIKNIGKTSRNHINKCINEYKEKVGQQLTMFEIDSTKKELTKSVDVEDTLIEKQINRLALGAKTNRDYIYKLFKLAGAGQVNLTFLQKEINKEFGRIDSINKVLLQALVDLQKARTMSWEDEKRKYRIEMESKLKEILSMYE